MKCFVVCVAVLYLVFPAHSGVAQDCPLGKYFHSELEGCKNCSTCPINEIIRKPCESHLDTVCGRFFEFKNFQQSPEENEYVDPESTHPDHHKNGKHHKKHHHGKKHPSNAPHPTSELHILPLDTTKPQTSQGGSVMDLTSAVSSGEEQWKTLAMALIGILCVVSVSLVLFIMTVCYIRHKRQAVEKEIIYDPEMMECQSTYVQVEPYVSSRDRLKSKSNIRALRELQQNAYDSGSDDSCGNPTPPSSRLLGQPVVGTGLTDDYDADNSGQTITTTKSSDYVYFNSPQNANGEP